LSIYTHLENRVGFNGCQNHEKIYMKSIVGLEQMSIHSGTVFIIRVVQICHTIGLIYCIAFRIYS
jgi:hypothetical protein